MAKKNIENEEENLLDKNIDVKQALKIALSVINKEYGAGSIVQGTKTAFPDIEFISTGSPLVDSKTGGGYPRGRIIEIFGPESAGKTTMAQLAITEHQKAGISCAYVDVEHALDLEYAQALGVNVEDLLISQPDCGEEALNIVDTLARSGAIGLIVIDSVAALIPKVELEGDIGDQFMGLQARLMSQALRKLSGTASTCNCTMIFINQIRMKIGVMYGNPETQPGGNALKFYASQRFDIRKRDLLKNESDIPIGQACTVKIIKNKVGPPFQVAEVNLIYGKGFDWARDIVNLSVEKNIIEKAGAWYSYNGQRIGQGFESVCELFRSKPELVQELKEKLKK